MPLPLSHGPQDGSQLVDKATFQSILTLLFNLHHCVNTQATQQTLTMHSKALTMKKMRDSAMSAQTKEMVRTTKVLLLSMRDYQGKPIIADNIPFSTCMLDLTERPGMSHISNQVTQITQDYNCSPHMPLWLKLIKINWFIAPPGVYFWGFSSWLFRLG